MGFFLTSFLLFMTDTSGRTTGASVIGDAAREGQIDVPLQENPLEANPLQTPAETPAATPEEAPVPAETQGGGN